MASVRPRLAVVDYGIGNLRSAEKALERVGADARLTTDAADVAAADGVVVPGVGAFGRTMEALESSGMREVVYASAVAARAGDGVPFIGICVGMQILFDDSDEDPGVSGLGVLRGRVAGLPSGVKRPQMQWNRLSLREPAHPLWAGLDARPWMYFVHSYSALAEAHAVAATCDYGDALVASVTEGRLSATQFHPEKSGANGLRFLRNFVDTCRG